mgnify:CR=1 FL=1
MEEILIIFPYSFLIIDGSKDLINLTALVRFTFITFSHSSISKSITSTLGCMYAALFTNTSTLRSFSVMYLSIDATPLGSFRSAAIE